jgi:PAS domain S-box-containing protein
MVKDKQPYHILVVEDNPGDYILIEDYLEETILHPNLIQAKTFKEFKALFEESKDDIQVILLDLTLPDKNGESLIVEAVNLAEDLPVIVLTGYTDASFAIKSLSLGASDYLLKDDMTSTALYKSIIYNIERKKSIVTLKESEKRYSDLFQLSPQPMWVYDLNTLAFLDVNQATITHYGYSFEEFMKMTVLDIRPKEDIGKFKEAIQNSARKNSFGSDGYFRHLKKDGTVIQVDIQSKMINFKGDKAVIILANDVTERLKHLEAIEKQNRQLREIAYTQSHIVRAPLARIMGLVNIVLSGNVTEKEKSEMLHFLQEAANEMDTVIRDIVSKTDQIEPGEK